MREANAHTVQPLVQSPSGARCGLNSEFTLDKPFGMPRRFAVEFRELIELARPKDLDVRTITSADRDGYFRETIAYEGDDGREVPAFLFIPKATNPVGGVVVFHQNAGEFHLGKSARRSSIGWSIERRTQSETRRKLRHGYAVPTADSSWRRAGAGTRARWRRPRPSGYRQFARRCPLRRN